MADVMLEKGSNRERLLETITGAELNQGTKGWLENVMVRSEIVWVAINQNRPNTRWVE